MGMVNRYVTLDFLIDTNRINARGNLPHMNQLEKWHENGVIAIEMSDVAQQESTKGGNATRTSKAYSYIFSVTRISNPSEFAIFKKIEHILFPDGPTKDSEKNDVLIIFKAWQDKSILITNEGKSRRQPGGMLGNRDKLKQLGIDVMTDEEAVTLVVKKIKERDRYAKRIAERTGEKLPSWVGTD